MAVSIIKSNDKIKFTKLAGKLSSQNLYLCLDVKEWTEVVQPARGESRVSLLWTAIFVLFCLTCIHCSTSSFLKSTDSAEGEESQEAYVKKPPNAYMLFMKEQRPNIPKDFWRKGSGAVNSHLGTMAIVFFFTLPFFLFYAFVSMSIAHLEFCLLSTVEVDV